MALLPGYPALSIIGLGKQSVYNTGVAASTWFAWQTLAKFQPVINAEIFRDGMGRSNVFQARIGTWVEFDFTTQLRPSAAVQALSYALGATDVLGHVTGTMVGTTLTGAGNTAGSTSIVVASSANAAIGDIMLITNVGGAVLSEYVQIKTVTDATHLALVTPLMNSYAATSTLVNAAGPTLLYGHAGGSAENQIPVLSLWYAMGYIGATNTALDFVQCVDCVITDFDLLADGGTHAAVNIKGTGRIAIPGQSAPTPALETDAALSFVNGVFAFNGGPFTITGGTSDITSVHINVKNNMIRQPVSGSEFPRLFNGTRDVTIDVKVFAEDVKPWRDVFYGADAGTTIATSNTVVPSMVFRYDYALASADHLVQLYCNNVVLRDAKPTFDVNAGPVIFDIPGTNMKSSPANASALPDLQYFALNADSSAY